ncbi:MAG: 3-dehydroquinate synthase [Bacteroidales bacterium]|nr:3-dehydroquinate synthase [Bacteroidales bacterium]
MELVEVKGSESFSQILIGESIDNLKNYTSNSKLFIITDGNVKRLYRNRFPIAPIFSIEPGETSKNFQIALNIYRWLLENNADRSSFIVGIGGGVVCDMAGFVSSTFMRGVNFGFVATTLLAQVDASVGGKNGIDLDGYKNIIGTFNQPKFVICDISMLKTLPTIEFANGMAEVVKHALISDKSMFDDIEKNRTEILALNKGLIEYLVTRSVKIKAGIVETDEREHGLRRVLNLGHTWGHAVEKLTGIPHGQAVSIGLVFAANLSVEKGQLSLDERDRLENILSNFGLATKTDANLKHVFEVLLKDKKRENEFIHFVLMKGIGSVEVERINLKELEKFIQK